jgi:hypothetical protein
MSLAAIAAAKAEAVRARARFETTVGAAQTRLQPRSLAEEAWDGAKAKGADLADEALQAVKQRPGKVSLTLGAFAIFLARRPLKRAIGRLISGDEDDATDKE